MNFRLQNVGKKPKTNLSLGLVSADDRRYEAGESLFPGRWAFEVVMNDGFTVKPVLEDIGLRLVTLQLELDTECSFRSAGGDFAD